MTLAVDGLVGRDTVMEALDTLTHALVDGSSAMAGVSGPLGVGRSAVLSHAATRARAVNAAVAVARCSPLESRVPYAVATQLMAGLCPPSEVIALATATRRRPQPFATVSRLCEIFLRLAADRPVLLAVDDLHLADAASLRWIRALGRRTGQSPILLLASSHAPLADHLGDDLLFDDLGPSEVHDFPLSPLTPAQSRVLLEARTGHHIADPELASVHAVTRGFPAILQAVAERALEQDMPLDSRSLFELTAAAQTAWYERASQTLRGLPADAATVLRVLAVVGDTLEPELAGTLAGLRATALDSALRTLVLAGLVTDTGAPRLPCNRMAAEVISGMPDAERDALRLRAAELSRRVGARAEVVADLLESAPAPSLPWAVAALSEAATLRLRQGRTGAAITALRRATREPMPDPERARLLTRLASVEVTVAPQASDGRLRQVLLRYAGRDTWPTVLHAADLLLGRGDAETARWVLAQLHQNAGSLGEAELSPLRALGRLAEEDAGIEPDTPVTPMPAPYDCTDDPAQAGALAWQLAIRAEDRARVVALAGRALDGPPDIPLMCRISAARALLCADEREAAISGFDAVIADSRQWDARATAAQALLYRAGAVLRQGRAEESLRDLAAATRELPLRSWHPLLLPRLTANEILAQLRCGRLAEARRVAERPLSGVGDSCLAWGFLLYAKAELDLITGDPARALVQLEECGRLLRSRRWWNPMLIPWRTTAAIAHQLLGDHTTAATLRAEEHRVLRQWGTGDSVDQLCADSLERLARYGVDLPRPPAPGGRAPDEEAAVLGELSAAEREVADLVVEGLANREIGERLSLATRTVELRLTKIYRRLGVQGRAALAARLAPAGRQG